MFCKCAVLFLVILLTASQLVQGKRTVSMRHYAGVYVICCLFLYIVHIFENFIISHAPRPSLVSK